MTGQAPAPGSAEGNLGAGLRTALLRGLAAFGIVLGVVVANTAVVGQLLRGTAPVRQAIGQGGGEGVGGGLLARSLQAGVLQFEAAHRVPLEGRFAGPPEGGGGIPALPEEVLRDGGVVVTVVPMLFTAFAMWLLFRAGRAAGAAAGGAATARTLVATAAAVPYAAGAFLAGLLVTLSVGLPVRTAPGAFPGAIEVSASPAGALLWPLALGGLAASLGGLRSAMEGRDGPVGAALAGGWRMLVAGMAFALVGLQVVSAFEPNLPLPYGPGFQGQIRRAGARTYLGLLDGALLFAPNAATWVLVPSTGGCDTVRVDAQDVDASIDILCYGSFPGPDADPVPAIVDTGQGPEAVDLPAAPPQYLLFLLVPMLATAWGGQLAARRAGARSRREGALAGAAAGVVFGLAVLVAAVLARASFVVFGAEGGDVGASVGPDPVLGTILALAWGVAGGAAGGATLRRRRGSALT